MGDQTTPSHLLNLVEIHGKGRGFVASQALTAGQILMRDTPIYAYSLSPLTQTPDNNNFFCHHCFTSLQSSPSTCPNSSCSAIFCTQTCQSSSLTSTHTPWVCHTLTHLKNSPLFANHPSTLQIEARCLVAVFNLAMLSPSVFQAFLSLDGCGARDGRSYLDSAVLLHSLFSVPSVEMVADILAKDWRNSFCLMGKGTKTVRGYAVYLNASLFNHCCVPNACHFSYLDSNDTAPHGDGKKNMELVVRVMRDVEQGEEVCISYLRVNSSYDDRQTRLKEYYTFDCCCQRCKVEEGGGESGLVRGYLERFLCKNESCQGLLAPLPPSCGGKRSEFMECNVCGEFTKRRDQG